MLITRTCVLATTRRFHLVHLLTALCAATCRLIDTPMLLRSDAVDFQMHSAIRSAGDPSTDHAWACPGEFGSARRLRFVTRMHMKKTPLLPSY